MSDYGTRPHIAGQRSLKQSPDPASNSQPHSESQDSRGDLRATEGVAIGSEVDLDFLSGDGEMSRLTRAFDWASTPVGAVENWPQSLRTAVAMLLASRHPMFLWWGPEMIQFYNDGYRPSLGSTKHPQALGQPGEECWPEIWPIIGPQIEAVTQRGESTWNEDHLVPIDRDGRREEVFWTYGYSPVRNELDEVAGVLVVVNETTGRVVGERRLRTLSDLAAATRAAKTVDDACAAAARVLADNPGDLPFALLYLLDEDGKHAHLVGPSPSPLNDLLRPAQIDLSAAAEEGVGWPLSEAARTGAVHVRDVIEKFGSICGEPWPEPVEEALVLPVVQQQGQKRPAGFLVAGISPRRPFNGEYRRFLDLVADRIASAVADARAYEQERRRAEALAELDRAKTTFFGNVSHEFRTPLSLMLGPLEDSLADCEHPLPTVQRERQDVVRRNALRLLKLVNSLLDFSRIEAGRTQAIYRPTDLAAFTADLASVFRSAVERVGMRLLIDLPPLPEAVYVDREMWEKIVLNLLSNAFKFTLQGEIEVRLRPDGRSVALSVRDTGIGISEHELPHLFERFHRVEGAQGRTYEGAGIGLALVRDLAGLHGGEVRAESVPGEGSTFTVTIPAGTSHLSEEHIESEPSSGSSTRAAALYVEEALRWAPELETEYRPQPSALDLEVPTVPSLVETSRALVLLADDNADMRGYVTRLLAQQNYRVEAVANGATALEAARKERPDLILTDVMMPVMDGFELLQTVRADPELREVPTILLSARAGEEAQVEGLQAGADAYLVKPFSARELLAHVNTQLELADVRRTTQEKLTRLFMQAPVAISVVTAPDLVYELANPRYLEMVGGRDLLGKSVPEAFPELPPDAPVLEMLRNVYRTGEGFTAADYHVSLDRDADGRPEDVYFQFTCQPVREPSGRVNTILTVAVDVTDQVLARRQVEELAQARKELNTHLENQVAERTSALIASERQVRRVASLLTMAEQEERRRISQILHDDLQQQLYGIQMKLSFAQDNAEAGDASAALEDIALAAQWLGQGIEMTRRLTVDLSPPILMNEGLTQALSWLVTQMKELHEFEVDLRAEHAFVIANKDMRVLLFQVVRELLFNAVKHAGTNRATVGLSDDDAGGITIQVADDGVGFDASTAPAQPKDERGFGLFSVRERLALFGGRLEIESARNEGTVVSVHLPSSGQIEAMS